MAICGMCTGKGTIRQETTVEGHRSMDTVMCPKCGGWVELEGRFIDEEASTPKRKRGMGYVDRAKKDGGYTWPTKNVRGKSRLNRRQSR